MAPSPKPQGSQHLRSDRGHRQAGCSAWTISRTWTNSTWPRIEREICRLPDVSIARLVAEPTGRVSEVHVVAHPGKHPKQIARDVQSIALASFGLELDRRIISVVQLGGDAFDRESMAVGFRSSVVAITAESNGLRSLVRVTL